MNNLMTENDAVELLYRGKGLHNIAFVDEVVKQFNNHAVELGLEEIVSSIEHSKEFNIPQHYKDIDENKWVEIRGFENAEVGTKSNFFLIKRTLWLKNSQESATFLLTRSLKFIRNFFTVNYDLTFNFIDFFR